jgi:hypothetical protein
MQFQEGNSDGEFSLAEDLVDNIPQYAILSHIWEEEEAIACLLTLLFQSVPGPSRFRFMHLRHASVWQPSTSAWQCPYVLFPSDLASYAGDVTHGHSIEPDS